MAEDIIQLRQFDSKAIITLATRGAGVYEQKMLTEGNSVLSTVFVESVSGAASVTVTYEDFTTGGDVGEAYLLQTHLPLSAALATDRQLVTRMHNKPVVRATVTGAGTIRFGVYITVVSSFASDLDSALKLHATVADLLKDKGLVAMCYDAMDGKFYFLPCEGGALKVTGTLTTETGGTPKALRSANGATTTVGGTFDVIAEATVPVGKTWRLRRLQGHCRGCGYYEVFIDGSKLAGVRLNSSSASENPIHSFIPYEELTAGKKIIVKYTQSFGPTVDVGAVLYYTET